MAAPVGCTGAGRMWWLARSDVPAPAPQIQTIARWAFLMVMRFIGETLMEYIGAVMRPKTSACEPQVAEAISSADEDEQLPLHESDGAIEVLEVQITA